MKILISMTDFVLEIDKNDKRLNGKYDAIISYANFLKTPLNLGMFVPCDENDNILEKPEFYYKQENLKHLKGMQLLIAEETNKRVSEYQKAKEKVLFNRFKIKDGLSISDEHSIFHPFWNYEGVWKISKGIKTIEDLIPYNLELTENFKP